MDYFILVLLFDSSYTPFTPFTQKIRAKENDPSIVFCYECEGKIALIKKLYLHQNQGKYELNDILGLQFSKTVRDGATYSPDDPTLRSGSMRFKDDHKTLLAADQEPEMFLPGIHAFRGTLEVPTDYLDAENRVVVALQWKIVEHVR